MITYTTDLTWKKEKPFLTASADDFVKKLENGDTLYEVLLDDKYEYKLYLDFDNEIVPSKFDADTAESIEYELVEMVDEALRTLVVGTNPIIKTGRSHSGQYSQWEFDRAKKRTVKAKYSLRFWIQNVRARKEQQKAFVIGFNNYCSQFKKNERIWKYIDKKPDLLDEAVYDSNRKMRCVGTSKPDENRPLVLGEDTVLSDTVITDFFADDCVTLPHLEATEKKNKRRPSPVSVCQVTESNGLPVNESDIYYKYINCIGSNMCGRAQYTECYKVLQACKNENLSVDHIDYWITRFASPVSKKYSYAVQKYQEQIYYTPLHCGERLTVKSLRFWAVKYNAELYSKYFVDYPLETKKVFKKYSDLITSCNDADIRDIYLKIVKNNIVFKQNKDVEKVYLYLDDEWKEISDKKSRVFCNHLVDVIKLYYLHALDLINEEKKKCVDDKTALQEIKKTETNINTIYSHAKSNNHGLNICSTIKNKLASVQSDIIFNLSPADYFNVHFKNGVYNIKEKQFRSRCQTDYVTIILPYSYIEERNIPQDIKDDVEGFFRKIQPEQEQRSFTLSYLSYCLTGNTTYQKFKMNIGHTGSNGKSTEIAVHTICFPIYTEKCDSRVLQLNFEKRHKFLSRLVNEPVRMLYFEELPKGKQMDVAWLKDFVDGKKITNEVLFGTKEDINIQAKIMTCSNHDFNCDTDGGILRRGLLQKYESRFTDPEKDGIAVDEEKHIYKKEYGFEDKFNSAEYKNAYFHLLLQHSGNLCIPTSCVESFKATAEGSDVVLNKILECYSFTCNEADVVSKAEFLDVTCVSSKEFDIYKCKLQSKGCKYDPQKKDKNRKYGLIYGIKKNEEEILTDEI